MKQNITTIQRTLTLGELLTITSLEIRQAARSIKRYATIYLKAKAAQCTMQNFIHAIDCGDHDLDDLTPALMLKITAGTVAFALLGAIAL